MKLFEKKEKKPLEPQYYTSATNMRTYNYNVYYMSKTEKLIYIIIGFAVGAAVGYLFYGGIGKDEFGRPTTLTYILDIVISALAGFIAARIFIPVRTQMIIKSKKKKLNAQFRDMLEALSTSLSSGKNVVDSFRAVYDDLKIQYDEGSAIIEELEIILAGMDNNIDIEDLLLDFGRRSGNPDIISFSNVFKICYRKGGNIKDTIRTTNEILSDKIEINEDIETIVSASKMEQNIMIAMPIILIAMIKSMSPDFAANFVTVSGILSTTVAIALFVGAYFVGKVILEIKV